MRKILVINATACETSGALIILRQVLAAAPTTGDWLYIVFVSPNAELESSNLNIRLVRIKRVKSFFRRFMWDAWGVKRWLKSNNIIPSATLSMQNTNFRTGYKIPNYIYLQQSIPFFKRRWSPLKKEERILWFYKNIYPFFIRIFLNKRTEFFVQLKYMQRAASEKFKIAPDRFHIVVPKFVAPQAKGSLAKLNPVKINLFYPAADFFYKNHHIIVQALEKCKKRGYFATYFTTPDCMGQISYEQVIEMYQSADALVFASYIESYGLPLLEAASFGIPIIASDLPYAREVLEGYEGVQFVPYNDAQAWAEAIDKLEKNKRYKQFIPTNQNSWEGMFRVIEKQQQYV